ncbi:hypothetical protein [Gracilibacillus salinarum]|uniref:Uncharacterized protein n=1 Tax=Gracilibacillus salinarum TaxID=2932255 RepID=A0ABY4GH14_9BACI|nr:hypothetical protein [Gracilibacillus salinarum]UOQ83547.1 hypothetical protein MUN87_12350 [Gracilibacillus salinarum]
MAVKIKWGMFIFVVAAVLTFGLSSHHVESYSTESAIQSVWEKYDVQSTMIGESDSVIWVDVYDKKEIPEIKEYLQNRLSKKDMEKYKIEVFSNKGITY